MKTVTAKKIYIRTFGCQMNEYDSNRIVDLMTGGNGYVKTPAPDDADLIVINTCSVRDKAQQKVFSELGRLKHLKSGNPDLKIAVGGCVASQEGKAIIEHAPFVDVVFGPQTLHRLPSMLDKCRQCRQSQVDVSFPGIEKFDYLPSPHTDGAAAFVSIMEGCSKFCTYCVVPYTRGQELSRPVLDVVKEVTSLAEQGVKEVTLLGQNVNAYLGALPDGQEIDFAMLLDFIAAIDGIERIRFMTSHPTHFSDRLIDAFRRIPKLAGHVHLPVQSGSDRILKLMKRGYSTDQYLQIIDRLKTARPGISITSDFIVGFPGETEEDFEQTMSLLARCGFDASFSFVFSPRPGTPAASMKDNVPHEVKLKRLQRLQKENDAKAAEISQAMVGTRQRVLVTSMSRKGCGMVAARTDNNRIVNFEGGPDLLGKMVEVDITEVRVHTLAGRLVNQDPEKEVR